MTANVEARRDKGGSRGVAAWPNAVRPVRQIYAILSEIGRLRSPGRLSAGKGVGLGPRAATTDSPKMLTRQGPTRLRPPRPKETCAILARLVKLAARPAGIPGHSAG